MDEEDFIRFSCEDEKRKKRETQFGKTCRNAGIDHIEVI